MKTRRRLGPRAGFASCSRSPTAGRSCSATAARRRSGTSPRSALIDGRSQHLVFGEFSSKFAEAAAAAPHLGEPVVVRSRPGVASRRPNPPRARRLRAHPQRDLDRCRDGRCTDRSAPTTTRSWSSTPRRAPAGCRGRPTRSTCTTSRPRSASPPTAGCGWRCARPGRSSGSSGSRRQRWIPASLDLSIALDNSRLDQTYNTPALATLFLLDQQVQWMLGQGGLPWCVERSRGVVGAAVRAGPRVGRGRRRSSPIRRSVRRSSAPSTSTACRRQRRERRRCGPTASSTPTRTASSAATSCASACSRRCPRPTSRR